MCVIILLITEVTKGQTIDSTVSITDTLSLNQRDLDSLVAAGDSTLGKPKRQSSLEYEVNYQSDDSMEVDLDAQKVYLYGNAVATYGDIELKAAYIEISLRQNELRATGLPDSNGIIIGEPVFAQGDQLFDAGEMRYNFKTKRGLSKHVKTQESGGYLHGETVKRDTGEVIYIQDGKYTTCEYDEPHFHIHASKLKVIPKDKIITGPAYLSIADIPTPLVLPFGFFPNTDRRANGILLPTWTNTSNQGFGIMNGGYYFGVGEIMDFSLTGDVYTRGGYAASINSNYVKRYKFRGGYTLRYNRTVFGKRLSRLQQYWNLQCAVVPLSRQQGSPWNIVQRIGGCGIQQGLSKRLQFFSRRLLKKPDELEYKIFEVFSKLTVQFDHVRFEQSKHPAAIHFDPGTASQFEHGSDLSF